MEASYEDAPWEDVTRHASPSSGFKARVSRVRSFGPADGPPVGPILDQETRDWIIGGIPSEFAEEVEHIGEIVKADKVKNMFELLVDGRRVPFDAQPAIATELLTWMRDDTIVRIRGKAIHRTIGGFQRLEVASIAMVQQDLGVSASVPCPLPISVQLADIARLQDGWLDGDGAAYAEEARLWRFSAPSAEFLFKSLPKIFSEPQLNILFSLGL